MSTPTSSRNHGTPPPAYTESPVPTTTPTATPAAVTDFSNSKLNAEATCYYGKTCSPHLVPKPRSEDTPVPAAAPIPAANVAPSAAVAGTNVAGTNLIKTAGPRAACTMGGQPCMGAAGSSNRHGLPPAPSPSPMGGAPTTKSVTPASADAATSTAAPSPKYRPPTTVSASKNNNTNSEQVYDYILVLDFEATCQENHFTFPHEIIEFPVVLIDTAQKKVVGEFHSFVKPKRFNGKLTPFCTQLTGITQEQVDAAPTLDAVINKFNRWMVNTIPIGTKVVFATDGPTDMENFMYKHSVLRDGHTFPRIFYRYLDVRRCFCSFSNNFKRNLGPKAMLTELGLEFEGRLHSGLDDTRNIARIVLEMMRSGFVFHEAFPVCELRKELQCGLAGAALYGGPPNYNSMAGIYKHPTTYNLLMTPPPASLEARLAPPPVLRAMGSVAVPTPQTTSTAPLDEESPKNVTPETEPSVKSPAADHENDEDEAAPPTPAEDYLLPQAAVDIVGKPLHVKPRHEDPTVVQQQSQQTRKRFATKKSTDNSAAAAAIHAAAKKLHMKPALLRSAAKSSSHTAKLPTDSSLDDLASNLTDGDYSYTNSPGLTSNSSFYSAPSLSPTLANIGPFGSAPATPVKNNNNNGAGVGPNSTVVFPKSKGGNNSKQHSKSSNNHGSNNNNAAARGGSRHKRRAVLKTTRVPAKQ